jgi:Tfp pilus assembly protein PilX
MSKRSSDDGFILLSVLTTTVFIMMIGVVSLQLITSNLRTAKSERYLINAQFAADAGIDDAVQRLNQDNTWTGTGTETTLLSDAKFKTTYQTVVTDGSNDFQKFIDVTAKTFVPASSTTPTYTRKYQVEMRGVGGGNYSIVSGVGGLEMVNNSKILGGQVYVNGNLTMSNSAQIGLSLLPVNVKVANQSCPIPANSTYPRVCNSGDGAPQPISISNPAKIYGEVQATNQTNGTYMYSPGLVSGNPSPAALPDYDRAGHIAAVSNSMSGASAGCSSGFRTWPANTKITGDVTVSGLCVITVEGNIWITGNLLLKNSATLIVKPGVSTPPVIMIDGPNGLATRNAAALVANLNIPPVGFKIITYASSVPCSTASVGACDVTGSDLYNSKDLTTISIENAASGAETEFYARWSKIDLKNSGNVGALVGQTVHLSNSAAITFGADVSGFTGPLAWVVKSYKRTF